MYTEISNRLPYIKIQNPPLKLLIDTGCYQSILRPTVAEKFYPEKIYHSPTIIRTGIGEKEIRFKADISAFSELNSNESITFLLFDFHPFYDGILGLGELLKFGLNINLIEQNLENEHMTIPFFYRKCDPELTQITVNAREIAPVRVPVSHEQDVDIIIPEQNIGKLHFPETLTTAKSGFAITEVINRSEEPIIVSFNSPLKAYILPDYHKESFNFFHTENFLPKSNLTKIYDIDELIRCEHLNTEERSVLINLCREFSDIFHKEDDRLTFTNKIKHEIRTSDEIPVHAKSYRYPFVHKNEVQRQINKMLEDGIIRPSKSPWSSPIWIVPKKMDATGKQKWRIVVDYRKVNEKTVDDRYPLPNINDILDKLGRCQYFSTLDLASGFHQIEMHPNSVEKTAFNVENGHYEYMRMPFGLKNAPATFQRIMDDVLSDLQGKICLVYMDDIIIFSANLEEHVKNLKLLFKRLREAKLKIQLDKSEFLRKEVEFLGHVVTPEGIRPNPRKIEAMQKFPIPKTSKEIKSFLGLLGYYRRFIQNFAKLTKPFTNCLKKGAKIEHTSEFVKTFDLCKNILCNDPLLQYPDFSKPFNLTTDASNVAIGAVLSQGKIGNDLPIGYASRTLNPAEKNYSTIEKELLAIVWATKYFRPYLFGRKFTIITDHKPLQWLFSLKEPNSRLVRWRLQLEEFDYNVVYKKGTCNTNADALSRIELNALENDSVTGNPGDISEEINKYFLSNEDSDSTEFENYLIPDETEEISAETLESLNDLFNPDAVRNKINIISDIQIRPPSNDDTVHSASENPVLNIPITENCLNMYENQIIFAQKNSGHYHVIRCTRFNRKSRNLVFLTSNCDEEIIKYFKENVDPKKVYCMFVKESNIDLAKKLSLLLPRIFKNNAYKLLITNRYLNDVIDVNRQKELISYHHEKTCHRGINETLLALKKLYYWPNMQKDLAEYINNCDVCQRTKYDRHPPEIVFSLTPTPTQPFEVIHMDTFQISSCKFLTIIDVFSRYAQAYSLEPICTSQTVLDNLLTFVAHHGLPLSITCDNGTEFKSSLLKDFCILHNIRLHFTTVGNSNSNSPVERLHSTIIEMLRVLKLKDPNANIRQLMQYAIIGYNSSAHSVTKQKPFDIINGRTDSLDPFDLTDELILNQFVIDRRERLKALYERIYQTALTAKTQTTNKHNEKRNDPPIFEPGSSAYVTDKSAKRNKIKPRKTKVTVLKDLGNKIETTTGKIIHKSQIQKPKVISVPQGNAPNTATPSCSYASNTGD